MTMFRSMGVALLLALTVAFVGMMPAMAQVESEADTVRANVLICADPDCADTLNMETMVGATVTSYHPDGSVVGSCTVTLTQADMVDCSLVPAPDRGSYDVWPADEYVGYRMVSAHPEVFESEMHGPIYVWYFAPEKDNLYPPPTQMPVDAVSGLPSTGSGSTLQSGLLAGAAFGIAVVAMGASALRGVRQNR